MRRAPSWLVSLVALVAGFALGTVLALAGAVP